MSIRVASKCGGPVLRVCTGDLRSSIRCAAVLLALLMIDWGEGTLTALRGVLWAGLGALLFLVLYPPRVTAGQGWLSSRGLLRKVSERIDRETALTVFRVSGLG
ncbi:hypothetical protein [Streptomyces mirabilis]